MIIKPVVYMLRELLAMYEKALLIYNGNAGQMEIENKLNMVTGILISQINELVLMKTLKPGDAEQICRERGEEYQLLLILGGDGTVHECINGLAELNAPPVIGILPSGTCNDFSRALNLPQQLDKAAEILLQGRINQVDIGRANDRYFTNFLGIGLVTDVSQNINSALKEKIGKFSYFISTLRKITSAEPFQFTLEHENGVEKGEAVLIYAANGRFLGTRSLPLSKNALVDGMLDVAVIREAGLPLLKDLITMKNLDAWPVNDNIQMIRTNQIKITTEPRLQADTDGEIYMRTPVRLSVLKQGLRFLIGEEDSVIV